MEKRERGVRLDEGLCRFFTQVSISLQNRWDFLIFLRNQNFFFLCFLKSAVSNDSLSCSVGGFWFRLNRNLLLISIRSAVLIDTQNTKNCFFLLQLGKLSIPSFFSYCNWWCDLVSAFFLWSLHTKVVQKKPPAGCGV